MTMLDSTEYDFVFSGSRELVDESRMIELIESFQDEDRTTYHSMSLRNKSYSDGAANVLSTFLKKLEGLRVLDAADMISGRPENEALRVLNTICSSLKGHSLVEIDVSDNALGEKGIRACFDILQNQNDLERIFFCNNGLSAAAVQVIVDELMLFRGLDTPTKLKLFHFYNNMSGDGGAENLSRLLPLCPELEDLRFSATRAGREGCCKFAQSLNNLNKLIKLDLSDNTFGEEGGLELSNALSHQQNLKHLNLRDTSLGNDGIIPILNALSKASYELEFLDLSGNELTEECIPALVEFLRKVPKLHTLLIEDNELGSDGAKQLMKGLRSLKGLKKIQINVNEISTLGGLAIVKTVAYLPSLVCLEINGNNFALSTIEKMKIILRNLGKENILQSLDDNCEDDDEEEDEEDDDVSEIEAEKETEEENSPMKVEKNSVDDVIDQLSDLHLPKSEPTIFTFEPKREVVNAERAIELLTSFEAKGSRSYDSISLRNKSYQEDGAHVMAKFLKDLKGLTKVDLADMIAGRPEEEALKVLTCICNALHGHALTSIDLSDNALGEKGVRACFGILQKQHNLKHLYFCNNGISAAAAEVIAKEVVLFRDNDEKTKLETFHFYNNMSGDGGGIALSAILKKSPDLKSLRFSATRAGREGSKAFAMGMQSLRNLEWLDLSDNTFGEEGAIELAKALKLQSNLTYLNLRDACLEDNGLIAIAEASLSPSLKTLDVSGNELTEESMQALSECLQSLPELEKLYVEENEIGSEGMKILMNGIQDHLPKLRVLVLNTNEIMSNGILSLMESLGNKSQLECLEVNGNMISNETIAQLKKKLLSLNKDRILGEMDENDEEGDEEN